MSCFEAFDNVHNYDIDVVVMGNCGLTDDYDGAGNNIKWCTPFEYPYEQRINEKVITPPQANANSEAMFVTTMYNGKTYKIMQTF